eukprot:474684_1
MLVFMLYIVVITVMVIINYFNLCNIYFRYTSLLIRNQIKLYIMTIILEWTLFFYSLFLLLIAEKNNIVLLNLAYDNIIPMKLSTGYSQIVGILAGNYFIFSVPFSIIALIYYYNKQSHTYIELWNIVEKNGYHTKEMFDKIYCINHISWHKQYVNKNINISENTAILSKKNRMKMHMECDEICLRYQRMYFRENNIYSSKQYRNELILKYFEHITPIKRIQEWICVKIAFRKHYYAKCGGWLVVLMVCLSRIISMFLTVIICNYFLFSYHIYLDNDNIAFIVMRIIGIFYMFILVFWLYYVIRIYYNEYMVGYIVNVESIDVTETLKYVNRFEYIIITNNIICKYAPLEDIASLISLYLFYPKQPSFTVSGSYGISCQ